MRVARVVQWGQQARQSLSGNSRQAIRANLIPEYLILQQSAHALLIRSGSRLIFVPRWACGAVNGGNRCQCSPNW